MDSANDYPTQSTEEFDYSNCVLVRTMEESPEYSSHDFSKIAELRWETHKANYHELDEDSDWVCVYKHEMLDQPVRRFQPLTTSTTAIVGENAADSHIVEVPDTGIIDHRTKRKRKRGGSTGMSDELFYRCLQNIAEGLEEIEGVHTPEGFHGRIKQEADKLRKQSEWQDREDEIFCRVVEQFAEIVDENKALKHKSPSSRSPDWVDEHKRQSPNWVKQEGKYKRSEEISKGADETIYLDRIEATRQAVSD